MEKSVKRLYREFVELYCRAYPNKSRGDCTDEANSKWKDLKVSGKVLDRDKYDKEITRLKARLIDKKKNLFDFLIPRKSSSVSSQASSGSTSSSSTVGSISSSAPENVALPTPSSNVEGLVSDNSSNKDPEVVVSDIDGEAEAEEDDNDVESRTYDSPAQRKAKDQLALINTKLVALNEARNLNIGDDSVLNLTTKIKGLTAQKNQILKQLKRLKSWQKNSKIQRDKRKKALSKILIDHPSLSTSLKVRSSAGRPPLEEIYPNLHHDILSIATIGAAASDRRREDLYRTVKTLDDLHNALDSMGYKICR